MERPLSDWKKKTGRQFWNVFRSGHAKKLAIMFGLDSRYAARCPSDSCLTEGDLIGLNNPLMPFRINLFDSQAAERLREVLEKAKTLLAT